MSKEIKGKVVSYCNIPRECVPEWLSCHRSGAFVEVHIDQDEEHDDLDTWLIDNYPGIENETFYIEMDY